MLYSKLNRRIIYYDHSRRFPFYSKQLRIWIKLGFRIRFRIQLVGLVG